MRKLTDTEVLIMAKELGLEDLDTPTFQAMLAVTAALKGLDIDAYELPNVLRRVADGWELVSKRKDQIEAFSEREAV